MKKLLWIGLVLGLMVTLASCDWFASLLAILAAPQGYVYDAKTGGGIDGVTVTLTYIEGAEEAPADNPTATTGTDGYYTFLDVTYGTYELSAAKTGYCFITQTVEVSGLAQYLADVIGFTYDANTQSYDISFVLMWNESFADVDAYLTYPNDVNINVSELTSHEFTTPYDIPAGALGAVPETGNSTTRDKIYYDNPTSASTYDFALVEGGPNDTYCVELDVDCQDGTGPETITVRYFPYDYYDNYESNDVTNTGGGTTGLPALTGGDFYLWVGAMEYYADAYASVALTPAEGDNLSNVGDVVGADAILYAFLGDTLLGLYKVPLYTSIKTASLIRVNMFWEYDDSAGKWYNFFQIVPNIKVFQSEAEIKGVFSTDDGIICVRGRERM